MYQLRTNYGLVTDQLAVRFRLLDYFAINADYSWTMDAEILFYHKSLNGPCFVNGPSWQRISRYLFIKHSPPKISRFNVPGCTWKMLAPFHKGRQLFANRNLSPKPFPCSKPRSVNTPYDIIFVEELHQAGHYTPVASNKM